VTNTELNTYADDNQLHFSHECPHIIEDSINEELNKSLMWFSLNSLKADKFQSLGLAPGRPSVDFQFRAIDKELKK
jgi:hypothetical protein